MRRAVITLVVAAALVLGACSKPDRPSLDRVAGTIEPSAGTDPSRGSDTTDPSGVSPTGAASGSPGATAQTPPTHEAGRQAAADQALAAYLDALEAEDFATARQVSSGGARFMAQIRDVVARYNTEREGTSTLRYSARSFRLMSTDATSVAYAGSARLDSTVSGPAGDPHSESALFENPVVSFEDGAWRVSAYIFNGQPLVHHPASSRQTVGGVELRLHGALTFGTSTGLVVDLITDSGHDIKVENAKLTYADGTSVVSTFGALISHEPAALYFLFDPSASRPVSWTAKVIIDGGTSGETSQDVRLQF